ncbi:hypothetical protein KC332_g11632 [Hortaea werneckii]|nr:hypothetical protein KC358_g6892 [Hortaea werneckii]KAI6835768.1 hypothetical protein KC350_g6436 [Hortaea werneckii]KAI6931194.1 hypothetical protein KC348_g7347 [Hortaea werneckii]KAI6935723.1 hypothetical protein KC341_g6712 [Hortaea werneckii]KAI6970589.1 hypothetical protein KC321_g7234 [Hortaea werneckii]
MAAPPFKVRALYEYASEHDDDLKFKEGQVIQVTEEEGDDWYVGEYADAAGTRQEGLFPRNFVEKVEPEVPQRPARSGRPKSGVVSSPPPPQPPQPEEEDKGQEAESKGAEAKEPEVPGPSAPAVSEPGQQQPPPIDPLAASSKQADDVASPPSAPQPPPPSPPAPQADAGAETPPASKPAAAAAEPAASQPAKAAPPPVAPKSNAFKDRIAAFNKPEAAPIAPMQAGKPQRNDYIKKPFVAPPPSKNAYVPPVQKQEPVQKPYIREEDPEIKQRQEDDRKAAEAAGLTGESEPPPKSAGGEGAEEEEDAPKPMTLKERMALLQREQEAQRARQAESSQKKKPPVKRASESEHGEAGESEEPRESVRSPGSERQSLDVSRDKPRGTSGQRRSEAPMSPVQAVPEHEILSGGEEADQSAAGEMTEDDSGTLGGGPEEAEDKHPPSSSGPQVPSRSGSGVGAFPIPQAAPPPPARDSSVSGGDGTTAGSRTAEEQEAEGDEEEEEEEVDEEEARKQRLRERMARLAGGQGAGGPFNPFGAPPPMAPPKKKSSTKERKEAGDEGPASPRQEQGPQMIAIPGMGGAPPVPGRDKETVASPEAVSRTSTGEMGGAEDEAPLSPPPRRSTQEERSSAPTPPRRSMQEEGRPMSGGAPPVPKDRPVPPPPGASTERGAPPPPPSDSSRPTPRPPPAESRPVPPPPPAGAASQQPPMSPATGYQTDDEMSMQDQRSSTGTPGPETPLPIRTGGAPPVPSREQPMSPGRQRTSGYFASEPSSATSDKRSSRPPIPGTQPQSPSVTSPRPPPPPPPGGAPAPPSRQGTDLSTQEQDEDEDVTERGESDYEGDYDTDIASSAKHKDALKSGHAREGSLDDSTTTGDEGTPVSTPGPAPAAAVPSQPRAVPPPPPGRPSVDAPRAPPPAPPAARDPATADDGEYDPYNYNASGSSAAPARAPPPPVPGAVPVTAPPIPPDPSTEKEEVEDSSADDMPGAETSSLPAAPSAPVSRKSMERPPPPPPGSASGAPPMPSRTSTRQSLDVNRQTSMGRKSMDAGRPSGDQLGQIAGEIDLAPESMWWTNPDPLPPVLANRNGLDILSESEESQKSRRGGRTTVSKDVYVLYMDYSQTVITAQYDAKDPGDCSLEQRHEPPPPRLRQDQLEAYWGKFGRAIAKAASELASGGGGGSSSSSKKDTTIGEGRPENLPLELIKRSAGKDALLPVGVRAYGALVYANLANASTMQYDEIRPGDILTLRNAKFEGHHGALKQRYKSEYGMQGGSGSTAGHVAVVEEWDGTRRSVRAWEQGREREGKERKAGGVRSEKFRLGDLRSGEVRVWRVVGRDWVGWAE